MNKIEEIEKRFKELKTRNQIASDNKTKIVTVLDMRRKDLKEKMQACRDSGNNPETLEQDINHLCEVLDIKMNNADADLTAAETIMAPMIKEINQ
jgi:hypothetical protein